MIVFQLKTSEWESTNIKDLYFAGVLMHVRDYKDKQSGFIHGFRYNIKSMYHQFEQKYYGQEWPHRVLEASSEILTDAIIKRVNQSSSLWQQTGFISDLVVVSNSEGTAKYYEDVPADYIHDFEFGQQNHYYILTLEFGLDLINKSPDPFAVSRIHKDDVDNAKLSSGIHPIVRRYCGSTLISEHHIIEDVASEWVESVHIKPLLDSMNTQLSIKEKPLGGYLLEAGLVSLDQLEDSLKTQKTTGEQLGDILVSKGIVNQTTVDYVMTKIVPIE